MATLVDKWAYGAFSPEWMAKALVHHLDRESLNLAVCYLVDHISEEGGIEFEDFLQMLVQIGATHKIVRTFDPFDEDGFGESLEDEGEHDGKPSKEEVDQWFDDWKINRGLGHTESEEDNDDDSN